MNKLKLFVIKDYKGNNINNKINRMIQTLRRYYIYRNFQIYVFIILKINFFCQTVENNKF